MMELQSIADLISEKDVYERFPKGPRRANGGGVLFSDKADLERARNFKPQPWPASVEFDRRQAEQSEALRAKLEDPMHRLLQNTYRNVVYFIKCGEFIKIGHTKEPIASRISAMRTGNPYEITLCAAVPGDISTERRFHQHLQEHRHRDEWFKIDERFLRRARVLVTGNGGKLIKCP